MIPVAHPVSTSRAFVICLVMLPVGFAALFIATYSVDVPHYDQWVTARLFVYLAEGSLSFTHLFAQHNEFRQFFPHLLFLALGTITRWNVRYEMVVSLLLACLVSINIYRISRVTITGAQKQLWLLVGANLLIFSPVQYETWLFGIQVVYFAPIACLTTCLSVAYSGLSPRAKLAIGVLLSIVSTFSSANGVLCWVLVLPVLLVVRDWRRPFVPSDRRLDGVVPAERELLPVRLSNASGTPEPDRIPGPSGSRSRLSRGVSGWSPGAGDWDLAACGGDTHRNPCVYPLCRRMRVPVGRVRGPIVAQTNDRLRHDRGVCAWDRADGDANSVGVWHPERAVFPLLDLLAVPSRLPDLPHTNRA